MLKYFTALLQNICRLSKWWPNCCQGDFASNKLYDGEFVVPAVCWEDSIYICPSKIILSVAEKKQKDLLGKNIYISQRENERLHRFLAARRWKCAKPIKYANPDRPVGALFINSQYLPGCVHEYSRPDVLDTHTTLRVSIFVSKSDMSSTYLNLIWEGRAVRPNALYVEE